MWFYNRPDPEIVEEAQQKYEEMELALRANRHNDARFAADAAWMAEHNGAQVLGMGTHKSMLAQMGVDTSREKKLRTVYALATERGVWDIAQTVPVDRAYKILKSKKEGDDHVWVVSDEDLGAWFADAQVLSTTDFNRKYAEAFGGTRHRKRFAINGAVQVYEIEPGDPDGMDADVVIDGGKVVKGEVG